MSMTRREMLGYAAHIYNYMVQGKRDSWIRKQLGLDHDDFANCKRFMLEEKSEQIRQQPREHYFIEYEADQKRNIKDLDDLIKNLDANSQYNALVGAIRLRSDIRDKIVNRAQEFGLVKKEATETRVLVGGVVLNQLDAAGLRKAIIDNTRELSGLMSKYGEKDFLALPPASGGALHYGPSIDVEGESADVDPDKDLDADDDDDKATKTAKTVARAAVALGAALKRRSGTAKSAR